MEGADEFVGAVTGEAVGDLTAALGLPVIRGSAFDLEAGEPLRHSLPIAPSLLGAKP